MTQISAPAVWARTRPLSPVKRWRLVAWLRPVEAIVRCTMLLAVLALPLAPARSPGRKRTRPARRTRPHASPECDHRPETWRVRFRILPAPRRKRPYVYRRRVQRDQSALPFARRIEALRRVIADPAPYIRALARALEGPAASRPRAPPPAARWGVRRVTQAARTGPCPRLRCELGDRGPS